MKLTVDLIFLLDKQAKQGLERVRIYKSRPLSPRRENSTPETGRAPGDSLSRPSSVFHKGKLRPRKGKGSVQFPREPGPRLGFLALPTPAPVLAAFLSPRWAAERCGNRSLALRQRLPLGAGSRGRGREALLCSLSPTRTCYILT